MSTSLLQARYLLSSVGRDTGKAKELSPAALSGASKEKGTLRQSAFKEEWQREGGRFRWQKNTTSRSHNRLRRRTGRLVMTRCRKQGHCFKVERREGYCSTKYGDSKGYWPRPYRPPPVADGDGDSGNSTAAGKHYRGLLQPERERRQEKRTAIYLSVHGSSSKRKRASAVVRGGITTATAPAIKASSVVGYR